MCHALLGAFRNLTYRLKEEEIITQRNQVTPKIQNLNPCSLDSKTLSTTL